MFQLLDMIGPLFGPQEYIPSGSDYLMLFAAVAIALVIIVCLYKVFGIKRVKVTKNGASNNKKSAKSKKKTTKKK